MRAVRAMYVAKLTIESKIDEVSAGNQQTAASDQHAVQDDRIVLRKGNAHHQQRQSWKCQSKWQRPMMTAIAVDECKQCKCAGTQHKTALKRVIGEKAQSQ